MPAAPSWLTFIMQDGNVVLRWGPDVDASHYGYEVVLMDGDTPGERLSPDPLRAAMWVDTGPPPGERIYAVRAVSASGMRSAFIVSDEVIVPER